MHLLCFCPAQRRGGHCVKVQKLENLFTLLAGQQSCIAELCNSVFKLLMKLFICLYFGLSPGVGAACMSGNGWERVKWKSRLLLNCYDLHMAYFITKLVCQLKLSVQGDQSTLVQRDFLFMSETCKQAFKLSLWFCIYICTNCWTHPEATWREWNLALSEHYFLKVKCSCVSNRWFWLSSQVEAERICGSAGSLGRVWCLQAISLLPLEKKRGWDKEGKGKRCNR